MRDGHSEHLPELDHLRFFAAAMVVLFHAALFAGAGRPDNPFQIPLIDQGHIGVQFFMVISGFILTTIFADRELDPIKFYLNRILRIYPLLILIVTFGYLTTPDPRPTTVGIDYILALLPISNLYRLDYGPFGGQMWTVAVELQFYLLFPLLLKFRRSYGALPFFAATIGMVTALRVAQYLTNGTAHTFTFFTLFGSIDLFIGGMIASEAYLHLRSKDVRFSAFWPLAAMVVVVATVTAAFSHPSFFHVDYHHVSSDGVSRSAYWIVWPTLQAALWGALLVLYLRSSARLPGSALFASFGKWSYSTYVWHVLIIELLKRQMLWMPSYLFGAIVLAVTLAVSCVSYWLVERPFLDLRSKYRPANTPSNSSAGAI